MRGIQDAYASPYIYAATYVHANPYADTDANKNANPCDRSADTIHTNRSTLPPGWTRGPCYAPDGTWTLTPKPTATNTPTDPPTSTPTYTPTPIGVRPPNDGSSGGPSHTPTPTPRSGPPPPPPIPIRPTVDRPFSAEVKYGGSTIEDALAVQWGIFQTGSVVIKVELNPNVPSANFTDYEFNLRVNSSETGFYVVRHGNEHCNPGNFGAQESDWQKGHITSAHLIRCALGEYSNDGFDVYARRDGDTGDGFVIGRTGKITQSWHRENPDVNYKLAVSTPLGTRPATLGPLFYKAADHERAIRRGASIVNAAMSNSASLTESSSSPAITVQTYWPGAPGVPCSFDWLACINIGGNYPHLTPKTLWIRIPPNANPKKLSYWTDDEKLAGDTSYKEGTYYFLPQVAAHEFGHGLGLSHLPDGYWPDGHIMGPTYQFYAARTRATSSDWQGMNSATTVHEHR